MLNWRYPRWRAPPSPPLASERRTFRRPQRPRQQLPLSPDKCLTSSLLSIPGRHCMLQLAPSPPQRQHLQRYPPNPWHPDHRELPAGRRQACWPLVYCSRSCRRNSCMSSLASAKERKSSSRIPLHTGDRPGFAEVAAHKPDLKPHRDHQANTDARSCPVSCGPSVSESDWGKVPYPKPFPVPGSQVGSSLSSGQGSSPVGSVNASGLFPT
jgi:hypothetical protein